MKTKAYVLEKLGQPLVLKELTIPELKRGQVLINIAYTGICRSQLNEIKGLKGEDKYLPHTLGHEGSGVVVAIGPEVSKVAPGDHVVLTWIVSTGIQAEASTYGNGPPVNSGPISTFMDKAVISENRLVKIPKDVSLKVASLLGCCVPTGCGMVLHMAAHDNVKSAVVFGVGGIGLAATMALKMQQVRNIIAVDIYDSKLETAKMAGATHTINARQNNALKEILTITQGAGVDLAIEAAGQKESMEAAFDSIRNGGLCILAGNLKKGEKISLDPFHLIAGKKLVGSWGGNSQPDRDISSYIDSYQSGKLDLDLLLACEYNFEQINQAMSDLENGLVPRAIVKI